MRVLFYLLLFLLTYGSLFPFNFDFSQTDFSFITNYRFRIGYVDAFGNTVVAVPLGYFATLYRRVQGRSATSALALALAVAFVVQIIQIYLPSRVPSLNDVILNAFGMGLGYGAAVITHKAGWHRLLELSSAATVPLLLGSAFLVYQLSPYVPVVDWGLFKDEINAVIRASARFNVTDWARNGLYWVLLGGLILGSRAKIHLRFLLPIIWLAVFGLRLLIYHNAPSLAQALGALAGVMAVLVLQLRFARAINGVAASAVLLIIAIEGVTPFAPRSTLQVPHLIPFAGYLTGSMMINWLSLTRKIFLFGSAIYFLHGSGWHRLPALILVMFLLFFVETFQVFVASGSPDLTDPFLALLLGIFIFKAMPSGAAREKFSVPPPPETVAPS